MKDMLINHVIKGDGISTIVQLLGHESSSVRGGALDLLSALFREIVLSQIPERHYVRILSLHFHSANRFCFRSKISLVGYRQTLKASMPPQPQLRVCEFKSC